MAHPFKPESEKHVKQSVSFPPDMLKRITAYCQKEERSISFVVQHAVDVWLKEKGY